MDLYNLKLNYFFKCICFSFLHTLVHLLIISIYFFSLQVGAIFGLLVPSRGGGGGRQR